MHLYVSNLEPDPETQTGQAELVERQTLQNVNE